MLNKEKASLLNINKENKMFKQRELPKLLEMKERMDVVSPFIGTSARNSLLGHDAASRLSMKEKQEVNSVALINGGEPTPLSNGLDYEIGDYVEKVVLPKDAIVVNLIPFGDVTRVVYDLPKGGGRDMVEVTDWGSNDSLYSYVMVLTKEFKELSIGDSFREDTVLAIGVSGYTGEFSYSINARVANVSHVDCSKDAIVVSDALLASGRLDYLTHRKVEVCLSRGDVLFNVNGTEEEYIPLPKVGDKVSSDGIIMAYFSKTSPLELTKKHLNNRELFMSNTCYELKGGVEPIDGCSSIVKRVKVVKIGNPRITELNRQLEEISLEHSNALESLVNKNVNDDGAVGMYYTELCKLQSHQDGTLYYKDVASHNEWLVEIVIENTVRPTIKDKLTTFHGSKGVISNIIPEHEMPTDSRGLRAEIIFDSTAIERRLIHGNKMEGYFFDNIIWNNKKFLERLNKKDKTVRKDILEYVNIYGNPVVSKIYKEASYEELIEVASNKGIRPVLNIYDKSDTPNYVLRKLMNSKFATPLDGLSLYNVEDPSKPIYLDQPIATEVVGIRLNYKNGESFQGVPTTYVNPLGGVVSPWKDIRKTKSYNISPLRAWSETEDRVGKHMGPEFIKFYKRMRILSNSPLAQARMVSHIMRRDVDSFKISKEEEEKIFKDTHDTPVNILNGLFLSYGIEIDTSAIRFDIRPPNTLE